MRILYLAIIFWGLILSVSGQALPDTLRETRQRPEFTRLLHKCSANVYLTRGDTQFIMVETDSAIVDRLRTDYLKGTLVIWTQTNIEKAICLNAYITAKNLRFIEASGKGRLESTNTLFADTLTLATKFFGGMNMNIQCNHLILEVSGEKPVILKGHTKTCEIRHNSAALIDATGMEIEKCDISVDKGGVVKIRVTREITGKTSENSSIYYLGDPVVVKIDPLNRGIVKKMSP